MGIKKTWEEKKLDADYRRLMAQRKRDKKKLQKAQSKEKSKKCYKKKYKPTPRRQKKKGQDFGNLLYHTRTEHELKLSEALFKERIIFEEQYPIRCHGVTYYADFYIENVFGEKYVIELDGYGHRTKEGRDKDDRRNAVMFNVHHIKTRRFWNPKSNAALERIVDAICELNPRTIRNDVNPSWPFDT